MDYNSAVALALKLIDEYNINYELEIDNKKSAAGTCTWKKKVIKLSKPFIEAMNEAEVKDVILHEIAHALTPYKGHSHEWKRKAIEIGCSGKRTCSIGIKGKYNFKCPNCNKSFSFHRKLKLKHCCSACCEKYNNGKADLKYQLVEV